MEYHKGYYRIIEFLHNSKTKNVGLVMHFPALQWFFIQTELTQAFEVSGLIDRLSKYVERDSKAYGGFILADFNWLGNRILFGPTRPLKSCEPIDCFSNMYEFLVTKQRSVPKQFVENEYEVPFSITATDHPDPLVCGL